jgi:D-alanyl-lipoteichoic acid acyltransferase DltB (MBOAT superfamily)
MRRRMLFHSQPFILGFLPLCLGGFFALGRIGGARWALRWLVAASLAFYAWWNPPFVALLAGSIAGNYAVGRRILSLAQAGFVQAARRWMVAGVTADLLLLGWFKYADFLLHTVVPGAPALYVFLPLAISFFTFQQIMFLVDSSRGDCPDTGFLTYAAFIAFFPHLIAGPIVRPCEILPQLAASGIAVPRAKNLSAGLLLFFLGLAKKLVLADTFGSFADTGFDAADHGAALSLFEAWYAVLAYALQIYFDFSGYSDMATGLARMLNVRFPLNFDSPYQAASITEFWRRWHMTLSRFLRDYLYIPLGGNRSGEARRVLNLMLTMLVGGLWHGAAWSFVLWGGLHGTGLVVHVLWQKTGRRMPRPVGQVLTLLAVIVAWVPFRASGLPAAWAMLRGMLGLNGAALPAMVVRFVPALERIADPVPVVPYLGDARTLSFPEVTACLMLGWFIVLALPNVHRMTERARGWALTSGFAFTVQALFFAPHVAPFLYFQF